MKIEDLEKLSDFEINKLVAEKEGLNNIQSYNGESFVEYEEVDSDTLKCYMESVNYCNSWADMGPIIFSTPIDVECEDIFNGHFVKGESLWVAHNPDGNHYHHKNPLRAAAIVYLMMGEEDGI